jgi:NADPH:quinone reductase-like Zn-dependent oxidoreductase
MKYKHIVIPRFGGPENLTLAEEELLEPRANEVRVKVLAAGVSFADVFMQGIHPESWNLGRTPFTPGWDVVGVVSLDQAAQAHELLASGSVNGKIVLICSD